MAGTTLLKYLLKTNIVKSIYFDIISKVSRYYYAYGRTTPWPTVTAFDEPTQQTVVVSSEENPPAAADSYAYELQARRNITYVKQVNSNDTAIVVNRVDWESGTVYDMYDDYSDDYVSYNGATSIDQAVFYVLTSEYSVYKCLYNNKNGQSYVQPSGTSTEPFKTADGYIWKFMYTIPLYLRNKFLSAAYMPVVTALSNQFYSNGAITSYTIEDAGAGYVPTAWKVKRIVITNGGVGYTSGTFQITFPLPTAPGGVRATAVVNDIGDQGDVISITITNQGSGYTTQPIPTITHGAGRGFEHLVEYERSSSSWTEIRVSGDGTNEDNPYSLKQITVVNRGEFPAGSVPGSDPLVYNVAQRRYGWQPAVNVTYREIEGNSGYYEIDTITVEDEGYGYTEPLVFGENVFFDGDLEQTVSLNLNTSSQKNHAILVPLISGSGQLEAIQISSPGVGYTYATIEIVGVQELLPGDPTSAFDFSTDSNDPGYVEGYDPASVVLNFGVGDIDTKQSNVELLAVEGSVPVVVVEEGGFGYSSVATQITVTGDGTGMVCEPVIVNGTITEINVTNPGAGYTYANVAATGAGSGAVFRAIISPKGGHGKDAISELYASTIMLVNRLSNEKNQTVPISNDFRQISILKNPKAYNTQSFFRNSVGYTCALLECDVNTINTAGFNGFQLDDTLTLLSDTSKTYTLVEKLARDNKYYLLVQINDNAVPQSGQTLYIGNYNMSVTGITQPSINKFSGEMLYIDNRVKFASSENQTIVTSTLISF